MLDHLTYTVCKAPSYIMWILNAVTVKEIKMDETSKNTAFSSTQLPVLIQTIKDIT